MKSDNHLVIIDPEFNHIMDINDYGERIVNICDMLPVVANNNNSNNSINNSNEKEKDSEKDVNNEGAGSGGGEKTDEENNKKNTKKGSDIKIALCGNKELYLTSLDLESMVQRTDRYPIPNIFGFSAIEMEKNNYVVVGKMEYHIL